MIVTSTPSFSDVKNAFTGAYFSMGTTLPLPFTSFVFSFYGCRIKLKEISSRLSLNLSI
jgi:hypothetical protein